LHPLPRKIICFPAAWAQKKLLSDPHPPRDPTSMRRLAVASYAFGSNLAAVMLPAQSAGELLHVASFLVVPFRYRIKRDFISLPHVVHVVGKVHVFPLKQVLLFDLRRLCA